VLVKIAQMSYCFYSKIKSSLRLKLVIQGIVFRDNSQSSDGCKVILNPVASFENPTAGRNAIDQDG
jgi:hypothetical protein